MEICISLTVLMWLVVEFTSCVPRRRKNENIHNFHTSGVPIAIDNLIQEYEKEYQNFHKEESRKDIVIKWPELDNKNLSNYCKKYLQQSVPTRSTYNAFGDIITRTLHYKTQRTNVTNKVILVQCKVVIKNRVLSYYMMRACVPNCVYGLISKRNNKEIIVNIINKYCDFEEKPMIVYKSLKRKRIDIISRIHKTTGEPIAKDEYLLQYELEHQELVEEKGEKDKFIDWPHAILHHNLHYFCYQYMRECVPDRDRESVKGKLNTEKLHYQKLKTIENIYMTVVTCHPLNMKFRYHFTRAPENNCVYALLRMSHNSNQPMVIVFKHCDFNDPHDKQTILYKCDDVEQSLFPKPEIKEEISNALETMQYFQQD